MVPLRGVHMAGLRLHLAEILVGADVVRVQRQRPVIGAPCRLPVATAPRRQFV